MRITLEYDLQIISAIQSLFLHLILKQKKFVLLNFLLQFRCLHDSHDLAEVLIKLGSNPKSRFKERPGNDYCKVIKDDNYPPVLQMGLDMLFRLKKIKELLEYYLALGMVIEALEVVKKDNYSTLNAKAFLESASREDSNCSIEDLINFLINHAKRYKAEKKEGFSFGEDVLAAVNEFQNNTLNQQPSQ